MNNNKTAAVISYITWIGFLIALFMGDRNDRFFSQHLNQALVLNIAIIVGAAVRVIPLLGGLATTFISMLVFVLAIMGIYRAATGSMRPLPFIGEIHIIDRM